MSCKNGHDDRICKDVTEIKEIKKKWLEHMEELYKKGLSEPDNHDGVVIHLQLGIMECEVK